MKGFLMGFISGLSFAFIFASYDYGEDFVARVQSIALGSKAIIGKPLSKSPSTVLKKFNLPQLVPPENFSVTQVNSTAELLKAVSVANENGGKTAIYLHDGEYVLRKSLVIRANDIMFLSVSADPYKVTLRGLGMKRTSRVNNIFQVRASGFVLDGIRLTEAPNHLIQIAAENNANRPIIRNCILQDSYEQLVKVSYDQVSRPQNISHDGIVEHCIFQYTQGIAPYFYTGGIDALGAKRWRVENNIFKDIASPGKHIAQHAVHFWINSSGNIIRNNIFIDNDRAIGFGMKQWIPEEKDLEYFSKGGIISGNIIYHANNGDIYADTGIILEASPQTIVKGNYILMQHSYPRAIEYRFKETKEALIEGNFTNKAIRSRDGGKAILTNNQENLDPLVFFTQLEQAMKAQQIVSLDYPIREPHQND